VDSADLSGQHETYDVSVQEITTGRPDALGPVAEVMRSLEALIAKSPPGHQLPTEADLCREFGVSRTSVRAAIQRLAERGHLSVEVGRGTFVREPDPRRLSEQLGLLIRLDRDSYWSITEARRVVETEIAGLAAARRTRQGLDVMRDALVGMDQAMTDPDLYAEHDERFHLAIATAADNEVLAMFSQQLQAMIRSARREIFSMVEISPRAQEIHWELYRSIERRAPADAMDATRRHLEEMEAYVRAMLSADSEAGVGSGQSTEIQG
jgi:GntR family transcriptional regulator, transcriptional repressor for pyruvate dehydrogenase complex